MDIKIEEGPKTHYHIVIGLTRYEVLEEPVEEVLEHIKAICGHKIMSERKKFNDNRTNVGRDSQEFR